MSKNGVVHNGQNQGDEYNAVFDPKQVTQQVAQQGVPNMIDFDQITVNLENFKVQKNSFCIKWPNVEIVMKDLFELVRWSDHHVDL